MNLSLEISNKPTWAGVPDGSCLVLRQKLAKKPSIVSLIRISICTGTEGLWTERLNIYRTEGSVPM